MSKLSAALHQDGAHLFQGQGYGAAATSAGDARADFSLAEAAAVTLANPGPGPDTIDGTPLGETLNGFGGADTIHGYGGDDRIDGGQGLDVMVGGTGNDLYVVSNAAEAPLELAGEGLDTVRATVSYALPSEVENLVLLGTLNLSGTGNGSANAITGNTGNNLLNGGLGADTLKGGAGSDTMIGGNGSDTYEVDVITDVVTELAGGGNDQIKAKLSWSLASDPFVEKLALLGLGNFDGTGNGLANVIAGNLGNNVLDGGANADTMSGGDGDDTYLIDNLNDVAVELANEGIDEVQTALTWTLSDPDIENLTLMGAASVNGTGNSGHNRIIGNGGDNLLLGGGAGDDTLSGGDGNDTLIASIYTDNELFGGEGADVISGSGLLSGDGGDDNLQAGGHLGSSAYADGGDGDDKININISANSAGGAYGGADDDNIVTRVGTNSTLWVEGNSGDDTIDVVTRDWLWGLTIVDGGAGIDTLLLSSFDDLGTGSTHWSSSFTGGAVGSQSARADVELLTSDLAGGALVTLYSATQQTLFQMRSIEEIPTMWGSSGDDLLFDLGTAPGFDHHGEQGFDTLYADWSSAANAITWVNTPSTVGAVNGGQLGGIERMILTTGSGNDLINNTGGGLADDDIVSGAGADTLTGGDGNDRLDGGVGEDKLHGDGGNDVLVVNDYFARAYGGMGDDTISQGDGGSFWSGRNIDGGAGNDSITGGAGADLGLYGGSDHDRIDGNGGGDLLLGEDGNDTLSGGADADFAYGGKGDDFLDGGTGTDNLSGGDGDDTLTGGIGSDADNFVLDSLIGSDLLTDFQSGVDLLRVMQVLIPIGDGDTALEGAVSISSPGGFSTSAEFVRVGNAAGLDAASAVAAIGSATGLYGLNDTRLFAVEHGNSSALYRYAETDNDGAISAQELQLLATLQNTPTLAASDLFFSL